LEFVDQIDAKGTGHAIKCSRNNLINTDVEDVLILSGDVPLISKETILNCLSNLNKCKIITTLVDEPSGLGRIILKNNKFIKIVEEKDCSNEEKKIKLINTGVYAFKKDILCKYILHLNNNNAQKEYYLTDIIEIIKENENIDIDMYEISKEKQYELTGVNTKQQLIDLNNLIKIKKDYANLSFL
jgi:bifunctional N-acetylglucosamine-1-phosphate-uridyltransferase/glucosamine-1-phosphate-acetyltransferase GlmU-like protein